MNNYAIKKIFWGVAIMLLTSFLALLILSILTYILKWQAPQAQVGIRLTYIVGGFIGGFFSCRIGEEDVIKNNLVCGMTQGALEMAILLGISILVSANAQWNLVQILLIWVLLSASCTLGISVARMRVLP